MHYRILILLFSVLYASVSWGQSKADSLISELEKACVDSLKLNLYIDIVYALESENPDKAILYGEEGVELGIRKKDHSRLIDLYTNLAFVPYVQGDYQGSIPYFLQGVESAKEAGDQKSLARLYSNLGISYRKLGDYSSCIDNQLQSLRIYEEMSDTAHIISAMGGVGNVYVFQGQYDQAESYFTKSYDLSIKIQDKESIANSLSRLGMLHDKQGDYHEAANDYESAIVNFEELNDQFNLAKMYTNLGQVYRKTKDFNKAESNMLKSLAIFEKYNADVEKATVQLSLSRIYQDKGDYKMAIGMASSALKVFKKHKTVTEEKVTYQNLSEMLEQNGDFEQALSNHKKYVIMKDSILNEEIALQINDLNTKYETEKKEKEIELLTQKNELKKKQQMLLIAGFLLILVVALGFFANYRQKQRHNAKVAQAKLEQHDKEIDILREKIAKGTTQYSEPDEFSIAPEEINKYLHDALTERELEILYLLAEGMTNKEIGEKIFVSINTVKFHLQKIYVKLDVNNRTQAVKEMTRLNKRTA